MYVFFLIFLVNIVLFMQEQTIQNYGLNCSLPTTLLSVSLFDNEYKVGQERVDSQETYKYYIRWMKKYQEEESELVRQLEKDEIDLGQVKLDYLAVNKLLAQALYLNDYGKYLDSIQANKNNMLFFSIFNDSNSFSERNIIKTAEEFEKLEGVSLTLGANEAITAFMRFSTTDYLLLFVLIVLCLSFLEERKKGLWSVVHAIPHSSRNFVV